MWSTIAFAILSLAVCQGFAQTPSIHLNSVAAQRFIKEVGNVSWPSRPRRIEFNCLSCAVFYHPSYMIIYAARDDDVNPSVVMSVHGCRRAGGVHACALERRGFPVAPAALRAVESAIANFDAQLFSDATGGNVTSTAAPNGTAPAFFRSADTAPHVAEHAEKDEL
jgi:hypothetical protein